MFVMFVVAKKISRWGFTKKRFFLARLVHFLPRATTTLFRQPQHGLLLLFQLRLRSRLLRLCRQVQGLRLLDVLLPRVRVRLQPRMRVVQALMLAVFV
jgi:hypothetical protein